MVEIYNGEADKLKKATTTATEDDWYPPTKNKPLPPIRTQGDVSFCKRCNANTVYLGTGCAVCAVPTGDFRLRYSGQAYSV
jgi:hypothetical protein